MDRRDNQGRLAIVAGSGGLPLNVANAARSRSDEPFIFAIKGESTADWSGFDHTDLGIGDIAGFKRISSEKQIDRIVLSGGVRVRPAWNEFRLNLGTLWRLPKLVRTLMHGGDNLVLTTAIGLLEGDGRRVIGAQDIAPGLVAELGPLGKHAPDRQAEIDIRISIRAARLLGELDIGQGVIAVGGRVVALEGPEGTDSMIGRIKRIADEGTDFAMGAPAFWSSFASRTRTCVSIFPPPGSRRSAMRMTPGCPALRWRQAAHCCSTDRTSSISPTAMKCSLSGSTPIPMERRDDAQDCRHCGREFPAISWVPAWSPKSSG